MKRVIFFLLLLLSSTILLAQQRGNKEQKIPEEYKIKMEKVYRLMGNEDVSFLFIGKYAEFYRKHPRGFWQFNPVRLVEFENIFPDKNEKIILFTNYISDSFSDFFHSLKSMGYSNLFVTKGDTRDWQEAGLPIEMGRQVEYKGIIYSFFDRYYKDDDAIYKRINDNWEPIAEFVDPTYRLFLKYTGKSNEIYGSYERFEIMNGFMMSLHAPVIHNDKIWFGISIYNGEGFDGYGGIGFFDLKTKRFGVLRHPALVNCSTREIYFGENSIYIATIGNHELSSSLCNGVVVLNLNTLKVISLLPPVRGFLWHKDFSTFLAQVYYDKPVEEMIEDERFVRDTTVANWDQEKRLKIQEVGLEKFMLKKYKQEVQARKFALQHPVIVLDSTFVYSNFNKTVNFRTKGFAKITIQSAKSRNMTVYKTRTTINYSNLDEPDSTRSQAYASVVSQSGDVIKKGVKTQSFIEVDLPNLGEVIVYPSNEYIEKMFKDWDMKPADREMKWKYSSDLYQYIVILKDFTLAYYRHPKAGKLPKFKSLRFRVKIGQLRN